MPSSHGGGSSGGFHGGSGGGFSFGGGSGGSSGPRFDPNKPFPGGRRYSYYNPYGRLCFFYYGGVPRRSNPLTALISSIVVMVFVIVVCSIFLAFMIPHKLKSKYCVPTDTYIEDNAQILGDATDLTADLRAFYDKTGVQPHVFTFKYADFPSKYGKLTETSLKDYAWQLYIDRYDEGHLLIVFAVNETPTGENDKWIWLDMCGDNAQNVFDDDLFKVFQTNMQRNLNRTGATYSQAIDSSFKATTAEALKITTSLKLSIALVVVIMLIFIIVPLMSGIRLYKQKKMINDYCDYVDKGGKNLDENGGSTNSSDDLLF